MKKTHRPVAHQHNKLQGSYAWRGRKPVAD